MDVGGDRDDLQPGDRLVLIVEHDPKFASILLEMAHQIGFKGLITSRGEMALELAQSTNPDAITLDLRLPDMAGWVVLDRLKHHPSTSHIPVHVISGDESWRRGVKRGAFAALQKPVDPRSLKEAFANLRSFLDRRIRSLLVVEDNEIERQNILDIGRRRRRPRHRRGQRRRGPGGPEGAAVRLRGRRPRPARHAAAWT